MTDWKAILSDVKAAKMKRASRKRHAHSQPQPKNPYHARSLFLAQLGFKSYDAYQRSKLWQDIRARVLARDGSTCIVCGKPAVCVHHHSYLPNVLRGDDINSLTSLCGRCHQRAEFNSGKKNGLKTANKKIRKFRKWNREDHEATASIHADLDRQFREAISG